MSVPLAVPNPPVAASLQAATRQPVRPTAMLLIRQTRTGADLVGDGQARLAAMFTELLGSDKDLWP